MAINKLSSRRICRPQISISPVMSLYAKGVVSGNMVRFIKLKSANKSWILRLLDDGVVFIDELTHDPLLPQQVILRDSTNNQHYRLFVNDNGDVETEIVLIEGGNMYA